MAGIADTYTIDLVAQDADGTYLLVMVEDRPWGTHPDQSAQLQEKLNTYASYVLDGGRTEGRAARARSRCTVTGRRRLTQRTWLLTMWAGP